MDIGYKEWQIQTPHMSKHSEELFGMLTKSIVYALFAQNTNTSLQIHHPPQIILTTLYGFLGNIVSEYKPNHKT